MKTFGWLREDWRYKLLYALAGSALFLCCLAAFNATMVWGEWSGQALRNRLLLMASPGLAGFGLFYARRKQAQGRSSVALLTLTVVIVPVATFALWVMVAFAEPS